MPIVKIGNFNYKKSTRKDKKLMVFLKGGKVVHFGNPNYQHFKDKTGIWKKLDHNDPQRRENYLKRAKGIKNKKGELTWKDPTSPNYHAIKILWNG